MICCIGSLDGFGPPPSPHYERYYHMFHIYTLIYDLVKTVASLEYHGVFLSVKKKKSFTL